MPTYRCLAPEGRLSDAQRSDVAQRITRAHHDLTGAPSFFAQVVFEEVPPGRLFVGGRPLEHDHLFVLGFIRDGRSAVRRTALARRLAAEVAAAIDAEPRAVWVYLSELPARHMVEFGRLLPEAGAESEWLSQLDPHLVAWMQSLSDEDDEDPTADALPSSPPGADG
jgi:phenylpyruvate tautomerase PptA (4-oxalocrotonate tautomerase family)